MSLEINGVSLAFDMLDAQDNARITQAVESASKAAQATSAASECESITQLCRIVFDCLNAAFGDGTDKRVFGEKTNLREALSAFDALIAEKDAQMAEFDRFATAMTSKYSPLRASPRAGK